MDSTLTALLLSAVSIGFIHALIGIDHSLPFVVLGRAQGWSLRKTLVITTLCGVGHVASSVLVGAFGVGIGMALFRLEQFEASRGALAAWAMMAFGLAYAAWSVARARRGQRHAHSHGDGRVHAHLHQDPHHHHSRFVPGAITAWSLFIIFVLGPCEPLIPLLMVPAASHGLPAAAWVATTFGAVTIGTMLLLVSVGYLGLTLPRFRWLEAHVHTLAGLSIAGAGAAIMVLGI